MAPGGGGATDVDAGESVILGCSIATCDAGAGGATALRRDGGGIVTVVVGFPAGAGADATVAGVAICGVGVVVIGPGVEAEGASITTGSP